MRGALNTFTEALRSYVVQVVAHADAHKVKGAALAKTLLEPLEKWESPSGSQPAIGEGGAPAPGVGGVPV